MEFDEMSRGEQFLHLLRLEYQELLRYARMQVAFILQSRDKYIYEDTEAIDTDLDFHQNSVQYYEGILRNMKGAENGEPIPIPSEDEGKSLKGQITELGCVIGL